MSRAILLVDDSATSRHVLKVYLMSRGYHFVEAETGGRGLQLLRLTPVDLIIADINMPRVSGLDFLRQVRESEEARVRATPVILITADKSLSKLREQALALGAAACLGKPLEEQELIATVDQLFLEPAP